MSAQTPARRKITAREAAKRFGVSPRTVQRLIAEPRAEFEARAEARRARAVELRKQGLTYKQIAAEMDTTTSIVGRLLQDARKHAAKAAKAAKAKNANAEPKS